MTDLIIKTGTEEDFFKRGRQLARVADRGERLPDVRIISFEDPADVMKLITGARLALFRTVKEMPGSITEISERLHRDRSAVCVARQERGDPPWRRARRSARAHALLHEPA